MEYQKDFNTTQAAIRAGYSPKTAYSIGQRLLKNVEVQNAMQAHKNKLIADRDERLIFLSETMRDDGQDIKHRLKAAELLAKSDGDFSITTKIQTSESNYDRKIRRKPLPLGMGSMSII